MKLNSKVMSLTLAEKIEILNDYNELSENCTLGDCLLRTKALEIFDGKTPLLSMHLLASEVAFSFAFAFLDSKAQFMKTGESSCNDHINSIEIVQDLYLCWSYRLDRRSSEDPEKVLKSVITFEYFNGGNDLIEWEPRNGPIKRYKKYEPEEDMINDPDINLHHLLGLYNSNELRWVQSEIEVIGIKEAVMECDYIKVRDILKKYSSELE